MSSLTDEQIQELRDAFEMFDKNGDGCISIQELRTTLTFLGITTTEEELQVIFNTVDTDRNNLIDFKDFCFLMTPCGVFMRPEEGVGECEKEDLLKEAFDVFDADKNGFIDAEELKQAMLSVGEDLNDQELTSLLASADINGDGKVEFEEFKRVYTIGTQSVDIPPQQ